MTVARRDFRATCTAAATSRRCETATASMPKAWASFAKSGPMSGVALFVEELLPLPDHSEIPVIDDRHVDVEALLNDRGQLAHGHLEAAVAAYYPHLGFRPRDLGADRRRQGKAHRAQPAGCNERP